MGRCEKSQSWKLHYQVTSKMCGRETELQRNNRSEDVKKTPVVKEIQVENSSSPLRDILHQEVVVPSGCLSFLFPVDSVNITFMYRAFGETVREV